MPDFRNLIDDPEPTQEDMAKFFALERELDALLLDPDQKERKDGILKNITQYIGTRDKFRQFLLSMETLLEEVRRRREVLSNSETTPPPHEGNERFDAYLSQFKVTDESHLRRLVADATDLLPRDDLIFLYTIVLGMQRARRTEEEK